MSYRIDFVPSAEQAFKKLETLIQKRIAKKIDVLAADPRARGIEKLSGQENR